MKIAPANIDNFLQSPTPNINFALIYGPDEGMVRQRSNLLCNSITDNQADPFGVIDMEFDTIKDDMATLADEIATVSMYGGRKYIRVYQIPASIPSNLKELIQTVQGDAFVVFTAGELSPRSSFRKFFETEKNIAAIACYPLENRNLAQYIRQQWEQAGFTYDHDAIPMLEHILSNSDLMLIRNELEKIMLYSYQKKHVTVEAVIACCRQELAASLDHLSNAIAAKNVSKVHQLFNSLIHENKYPAVSVIRIVRDYFYRLYLVRYKVDQGMDINEAIQALKPPVFYKNKPSFTQNVRNWPMVRIASLIQKLQKAEIECKRTGSPVDTICKQLFTILAA